MPLPGYRLGCITVAPVIALFHAQVEVVQLGLETSGLAWFVVCVIILKIELEVGSNHVLLNSSIQ